MKTTWKEIWEDKGRDVTDYSHENLLKSNGFDGDQAIITPTTLIEAQKVYEEKIKLVAGDSIYEVGCGSGAFLYNWCKRGHQVGGCDLSSGLIELADRALPEGSWENCEAKDINTRREYDHLVAFSMFFYFPDFDYAKHVLYRMIMKAKKSVSILDVPDFAKKLESENARRSLIPDYDSKYSKTQHLYYPKSWWETTLNDLGVKYEIYNQDITGYENGNYRYNVTIVL
jgi:trans-aconitate methyltransferase